MDHATLAIFGLPGGVEWIIIAGAALLLFGGRRLPGIARAFGQSIVEFKKGLHDVKDQIDDASNEPNKPILPPKDDSTSESRPPARTGNEPTHPKKDENATESRDPAHS